MRRSPLFAAHRRRPFSHCRSTCNADGCAAEPRDGSRAAFHNASHLPRLERPGLAELRAGSGGKTLEASGHAGFCRDARALGTGQEKDLLRAAPCRR